MNHMMIYKITNNINNKIYIGQTIRSLHEREMEYGRMKFSNIYLVSSFKKYGFKNFRFETIDTANDIDELNQKEIYWIKHYNSTNKLVGYNILEGGRNSLKPDETKLKMSNAHKGSIQSKEWIDKRIAKAGSDDAKKYGKEKTEEQKQLISQNHAKYWKGKNRDEDTKLKISISKKGQLPSNCKLVFKISKDLNIILDTYKSTSEASRNNPTFTQSQISRICNNKAESKENFSFSFAYHG